MMSCFICFDDVTAVVIRNNQRPWASWKTSAHTHALPHTLTHVLRNPCVVLQCHTQQIPSTDKISRRLDKRKTHQEKNLFTLLSVTVCVIAKTCKCLCHKLPKSQLNVSQTSRWMLSQPCALPTSAKFVSCYSTHPRRCCHPLLGNCGEMAGATSRVSLPVLRSDRRLENATGHTEGQKKIKNIKGHYITRYQTMYDILSMQKLVSK